LAARGREWGEERVYYRDGLGRLRFLPACWTSLAAPDPFIQTAAGRAYFRLETLIRLEAQVKACVWNAPVPRRLVSSK
jgi:hypothetical protein